jgi:hypothetical protein
VQESDVTENEARTLRLSVDALAVGAALPTVPLWISEARYIPSNSSESTRTPAAACGSPDALAAPGRVGAGKSPIKINLLG